VRVAGSERACAAGGDMKGWDTWLICGHGLPVFSPTAAWSSSSAPARMR
jgi:hypothetical protein